MSRRARIAAIAAASLAALVVLAAVAGVLLLRSQWFREQVRTRIVAEVERATGGHAEVGSFVLEWRTLRAELRGFVLHGSEPAGKPPLFQARSITVGLRVLSFLERKVDLAFLRVDQPRIYLIFYPGGGTNVPAPKIRRAVRRPALETIVDLAIRRVEVDGGIFEVESRGKTNFHGRGENLRALLAYDFAGPRYQGKVALSPFHVQWGEHRPLPVNVDLAVSILPQRIDVTSGALTTADTRVDFSGAVIDLPNFTARFEYKARVNLPDLERILELRAPPSGEALAWGTFTFNGLAHYHATGNLQAARVAWKEEFVRLREFRAAGPFDWNPERLRADDLRLSGSAVLGRQTSAVPVEGSIKSVTLRGNELETAGIRIATLGGVFSGRARLREWHRYRVEGAIDGFAARRLLALYTTRRAPWDGRVSGTLNLEGSFRARNTLLATALLSIAPAASGPPVTGAIQAAYDARQGTLDLSRSTLSLPATRVDFSGTLGRELEFRIDSRDLNDLLPALDTESLPVRLEKGEATFGGTVTGKLQEPQIRGRVSASGLAWSGARFDSFTAAVTASRDNVQLDNAALGRGSLRAQFEASAGLRDGKLVDSSPIWVKGAVRDAGVTDLVALAGRSGLPATGTLSATGQISGTRAAPLAAVELSAVNGTLYGEPYDRIEGKATYAGNALQLSDAVWMAGTRRIGLSATYQHKPDEFARGRLHFQATSNRMAAEQFRKFHEARPDLTAELQFTAAGDAEVTPSRTGPPKLHMVAVSGDATAARVAMNGQALGDAHVVASTKGDTLTAVLTSDFAGSALRGEGEWRLADDFPGTARLTFSRLDFIRLARLLATKGKPPRLAGSMAGEITLDGPILETGKWRASIRIPEMQLGPAPDTQLANGNGRYLSLRNSGPITATMANGVLRVEQARFVGRATDLTLKGAVRMEQANALDLRLNGRIDLATLEDFDRDINASGFVNTDATIRGKLSDPQITGRMEVKNAAFNLTDWPNGISNANGLITFTGMRGTIQNFTGESGGGKVRMYGFAAYEDGLLVFRLGLRATQVRVRYPEGVSTVANASLNWTGSEERSTLAGTVTILRTGFNPHSDLSTILASSAEPVRTPAAQTGILGGVHFDVQIETSPDVTFQSSLAQDIQLEANLRLRGTGSNPSVLGRINITRGQLVFFGTKYTINQGSISFFNAARIEPILNIDLETKARGIDVTLTVSGPINKLNLTPRSDPPLQFSEIVALLATGRAPTSDVSVLTQQPNTTQTWQQMGASALLGQAIANPVAGRLQRFFGVTRLKIDPTLAGVENNPQARLTLEQQITPNITFTYITNLTNSNPLVVQVEWALSRKWSVIAVREENGLFGVDFLYKKRF